MRSEQVSGYLDEMDEHYDDEQPERVADSQLREYAYWIARAAEHAEDPRLGYASESYRAAAQMAYRALGRYDILSRP